jgi:hypothetical protein
MKRGIREGCEATYRHGRRSNLAGIQGELRGRINQGGNSLRRVFRSKLEDDFALTCGTRRQREKEVLGAYRFGICRWAMGGFCYRAEGVPDASFYFYFLFFFSFSVFLFL